MESPRTSRILRKLIVENKVFAYISDNMSGQRRSPRVMENNAITENEILKQRLAECERDQLDTLIIMIKQKQQEMVDDGKLMSDVNVPGLQDNLSKFSSAGREYIGNPPRGSQRSMGLSIDVKDYRDEDPIGRLASLAAEAYSNRTGNKLTTIAYDGWGMWQAGSKKMNPGSYGYPDSVYFGVANEAQEMGGSGIEPGGATESAAINRMIQGGVQNMSPLEQLVAARAQINQSQAGKDTDWLTSPESLFAEPKAKENEKGFYSDLFFRASDSNLFADAFKGAGITDYDTINKALNVTGTGDGKNVFGISPKFKFNTDDNNLFNNIYKPSESNKKAQFNVQGGDTDTNQNKTPTKGGFNGSLDRTKPFSVSPLDLSSNMFPFGSVIPPNKVKIRNFISVHTTVVLPTHSICIIFTAINNFTRSTWLIFPQAIQVIHYHTV